MDIERFLAIMARMFRSYVDDIWGPIHGPGGPHIRWGLEPDPHPWRELGVAFEVVKLAEAFEFAAEGTGLAFLTRFADDPDGWCGTRPPGRPHPPRDEELLDPAVLGAALHFVAAGVSNEDLAGLARELGQNMIR